MVDILILSHSKDLALGVKELASQMAPSIKIYAIGGTADGEIGSDAEKIIEAITNPSKDGLIVLFDLGSSMMNAQMAYEFIEENKKHLVYIADLPLVEGAVQIAVKAQGGDCLEEIIKYCDENKYGKLA